jgi:uncharacterized membrane protein
MNALSHFFCLVGAIAIGTLLRFVNLDLKPLWQDEVITALLSLGQGYTAVPLNQAVSLSALTEVLTLKSASCGQIATLVTTQSVHPPLFFCGLHEWLAGIQVLPFSLIWQLRALPALAGVGTIVAVYALNRIAFSPRAGLLAAWVMAVSPFAVYLSQEARHYTLPMLLVTVALVCLVKLQQDWQRGQLSPTAWVVWVVANSLGLYTHYFFILAVIAQILTLMGLWVGIRGDNRGVWGVEKGAGAQEEALPTAEFSEILARPIDLPPAFWRALILSVSVLTLTYVPWLPTLLSHLSRPETDWLKPFEPSWVDGIAPLWQFPIGWLLMVIALPIEQQPLWMMIPAIGLTLLFTLWLVRQIIRGVRQLWRRPDSRLSMVVLSNFVIWVGLGFLGIIYGLHKDITQIPRYNFIYYPAVCALLGAIVAMGHPQSRPDATAQESHPVGVWQVKIADSQPRVNRGNQAPWRSAAFILLTVGILSSLFVITDQVLHKPYFPERVAQDMAQPPGNTLVVMSYENLQDVALGLSFALALQRRQPPPDLSFALMTRSPTYAHLWKTLPTLPGAPPKPAHLWIIGPGLRQREFPARLALAQTTCQLDETRFRRIGIPYQGYQCGP